MFIFFIFILGQKNLDDMEIYRPIISSKACVSDDGFVHVLDRDNTRVLTFDTEGQFVRSFCKQGQGPGEMETVISIEYMDGNLYVCDYRSINTFSTNGEFLVKIPMQGDTFGLYYHRLPEQWLVVPGAYLLRSLNPIEINIFDNYLGDSKTIFSCSNPNVKKGLVYNPIPKDKFHFALDATRRYIYLRGPGESKVHVYDVHKQQMIENIVKVLPRIPVDKNLAEKGFKRFARTVRQKYNKSPKMDIPDYYPSITGLYALPDGGVLINYGGGTRGGTIACDATGHELSVPFTSSSSLKRIVGVLEPNFYISVFDFEKEVSTIIKVNRKEVAAFLAGTPFQEKQYFERKRYP